MAINKELYDKVFTFVEEAIRELFPRTRHVVISKDTSFKQDLNLDSLDGVDFLLYTEEQFNSSLMNDDNPEEKAMFQNAMSGTVDDMVKCLIALTEKKGIKWE